MVLGPQRGVQQNWGSSTVRRPPALAQGSFYSAECYLEKKIKP